MFGDGIGGSHARDVGFELGGDDFRVISEGVGSSVGADEGGRVDFGFLDSEGVKFFVLFEEGLDDGLEAAVGYVDGREIGG